MSEARRPNDPSPQDMLLRIAMGYMLARGVHVAAEMGIADLLNDGPKRIEELAKATGADFAIAPSCAAHARRKWRFRGGFFGAL